MRRAWVAFLPLAIAAGAGCGRDEPGNPCEETARVYAAAVSAVAKGRDRSSRLVTLLADISALDAPESAPAELVADYAAAQSALLATTCERELERRFDCIAPARLEQMFDAGRFQGWERFHATFSKSAYWTLSGIGFAADGTQALCLVGFRADGLGGDGHFVHLEKRGGRWVVLGVTLAWIG